MENQKKYFVLHLLPSRPTFAMDMSPLEREIMQRHIVYWNDLMSKGFVLAFGPVMDPKGIYGLGIIEVDNADQVNSFISNDPANGLNRYEFFPMMAVVPKK
ncbi:MAG: YciI family protein [Chitinophagales bacterium]